MNPIARCAVVALALAVLVSAAAPPGTAAARDLDKLDRGPRVGARLPHPLTASDHTGAQQDFDSLKGRRGLILLFSRSVDWCVYCKAEAVAWNRQLGDVRALGFGFAILTYDRVADSAAFARNRGIRYPILSDPKSAIIRAFGLLNEAHPPGSFAHGIPHPIVFVVDAAGVIRLRFSEDTYRRRPDPAVVLDTIRRRLGRPGGG